MIFCYYGLKVSATVTRIQARVHVMISNSKLATYEQVRSIVREHVAALEPYVGFGGEMDGKAAAVLEWLERLSDACRRPPENASVAQVEQVGDDLEKLDDFLRLMSQVLDAEFETTPVGAVWSRALVWVNAASRKFNHFTRDQVWDWIAPAIPDSLDDLGHNVFEAKWAAPVPQMDIEIFRRTEGVEIQGGPIEPENMPNGIGFRFSIRRVAMRSPWSGSGEL